MDMFLTFDVERNWYLSAYGDYMIDMNACLKIMDVDLQHAFFSMSLKLQKLELSIEELALLKAVQLLAPGLLKCILVLQLYYSQNDGNKIIKHKILSNTDL